MTAFLAIPLEFRLLLMFLLGTAIGSFLNLLIYRLRFEIRPISPWNDLWEATFGRFVVPPSGGPPAGDEHSAKSSHSGKSTSLTDKSEKKKPRPQGGPPKPHWYDRIPLFGWLFWSREIAYFGNRFWLRPFLLELFAGAFFAWLYDWETTQQALWLPGRITVFGLGQEVLHWQFASHVVLCSLMIVASFIDWDEFHIPDVITVTGAVVGLALAAWVPFSHLPDGAILLPPSPIYLEANSPNLWPAFLAPGSGPALAIALGCFLFWCFALTPRVWRTRRGWGMARRIFVAHMVRERITYVSLILAVLGSGGVFAGWMWLPALHWQSLVSSLIGLAFGVVIIWAVRLIGAVMLRREAMGFGDVTLVAMMGAFLGWQPCLILFFVGPWFGLLAAVLMLVSKKAWDHPIPYGPFLCLGALTTLICWSTIWGSLNAVFGVPGLVPIVLAICGPLMVLLLAISQLGKLLFRRRKREKLAAKD